MAGKVAYDAAGRQTASVDAAGVRTSQTYDANGNRTSVTVEGRTTRYEYDALNRLTKTTWPDGSTHSVVYRADNRKQSETDARGVTTTYGWDAAGRLTSVSQTLSATASATTQYGYDATGAKVSQTDALGRTTTWTLDANGRITARQIQDGAKETSQYDAEGNRLAKTTFAGETFSYQYDADNRLVGEVIPASATQAPGASVSYQYTASGQLAAQTEQGASTLAGAQTYKYDANDRLIELKNPIGQISWGLDAAGNITQRSIAGVGTTRSEYDAAGRLVKVIAPDGKEARYAYDAAGRLTTTERELQPKNGQAQLLITHQRYDSADRLIALAEVKQVGGSETLIAGQALTRNAGGTITRIDTYRVGASFDSASGQFAGTPARTQAFEYDANARLTRETSTKDGASIDTAYEYDAAGNRTKKTVTTPSGTQVTSYSYDAADRLTQESTSQAAGGSFTTTYEWDGNGNLKAKNEPGKVTLYRFDARNRLIDIRSGPTKAEANAATPSVSYAYDAAGNRIKKGGAQATSYLIDPSHTYAQLALEIKGAETTAYVRGLQLIRQTKTSGQAAEDLYPLHGHLATSLGAVDASGDVVEQIDVDAFGGFQQAAPAKLAHLYTGEYWDQDSQLLYLRARWYDLKLGRFVSADPIEGRPRDPRTLNRYAYAHNDPAHLVDPSGKFGLVASPVMSGMVNVGARATGALVARGVMLRIAAQMIRTGSRATSLVKLLTRECAGDAAMNNRDCMGELPTFFLGDDYQGHTHFVALAQSATSPAILHRRPREPGAWYASKPECKGRTGGGTGMDCDEYPYGSTAEGGPENYAEGTVALEPVSVGDNRGAGAKLRAFYSNSKCPVSAAGESSRFEVVPLPGNPETFWSCRK